MTSTVAYRVATYAGEVVVRDVDPDEETSTVIARAKKQIERINGPLPFGSESWREVSRKDE